MAGRFAYVLVAGAALVGGMYFEGDLDSDDHDVRAVVVDDGDRAIDRNVDRETRKISGGDENGSSADRDAATRRALVEAVAELVRAEGSLVTARLDDQTPAAVIKQAEHRRDLARQAVERLADDAKAGSRGDRDALRQNIRDEIRDAVRG